MRGLVALVCAMGAVSAWGQTASGTVTFITAENVYVRFASTTGIESGDTLRTPAGEPCLVVQQRSSTSCVSVPLGGCAPVEGDAFVARLRVEEEVADEVVVELERPEVVLEEQEVALPPQLRVKGRLTSSVFATGVDRGGERSVTSARWSSRLTLRVEHVAVAGRLVDFDVSANLQRIYRDASSSTPGWRGRNTVYQAAASTELGGGVEVAVGRRLARGFSTVGSLDGLHAGWRRGPWELGVVAGFQPNLLTQGVATDRPVFGGLVGRQVRTEGASTDWRLGFLGQTRNGTSDRHFLFGQYRLHLGSAWRFFGSAEWDLYAPAGYAPTGPRALFASAQWNFARGWSAFASADRRAPVLRFATYDDITLQAMSDRPAQNVLRARLSGRLGTAHRLSLGWSDRRESTRLGSTAQLQYTWTELPRLGGRLSYSAFITAMPLMTSTSQRLAYQRGSVGAHYRMGRSRFEQEGLPIAVQHYAGANVRARFSEIWQASASVEAAFQHHQTLLQLQFSLTYRFESTDDSTQ